MPSPNLRSSIVSLCRSEGCRNKRSIDDDDSGGGGCDDEDDDTDVISENIRLLSTFIASYSVF